MLLEFPGSRPWPDSWAAARARVAAAQRAPLAPPAAPAAVLAARILATVPPEYPPLARQARIQGLVRLMVKLGTDGSLKAMTVVSGHPLLIPPALAAVKQWTFSRAAAEETGVVEVPFKLPAP